MRDMMTMKVKRLLSVVITCAIFAVFAGCDKADQAVKTIEKARIMKEDLTKKAKEFRTDVERKGKELQGQAKKAIPDPTRSLLPAEKKGPEKSQNKGEDRGKEGVTDRTAIGISLGNK
jgi:hypothetical protein